MARKSTKPRQKLSFSVDRGEFEITSDWVDSVMDLSAAGTAVPDANTATGEVSTTDTGNAPVVDGSTEPEDASVAVSATDLHRTVEDSTTVELHEVKADEENAPVVNNNTGARRWKPRPIRLAADGLTTGQYAVYSIMYAHSEPGEAGQRIYRGGYADLCRLTGMSKRGVQNVVGELRQKCAIQLHTPPGHRPLDTSAYTILAPEAVVDLWKSQGWHFAVGKSKILTRGE